jgi:hypothetical protein
MTTAICSGGPPDCLRVSGERGGEGDERVRFTRVEGGTRRSKAPAVIALTTK